MVSEVLGVKATFVVINYNGEKFIGRCLESIKKQSYKNFEIILVDNGSSDGSLEIAKSFADELEIEIIKNSENLGFAKAANQGIKRADSELVALVNNDAFLDERWLEEIAKACKNDDSAGIFASKILFPDGRINSAGHIIYRGLAVMERGFFEKDSGQYDFDCYVAGACAAAAAYRRELFDEIGFFDEDYFMYNEDVDLSLRAILFGWKIRFVPRAVAWHLHSASTGFLSDFSVYYNSRNWVWSILKNIPTKVLLKEMPFFLLRNLTSVAYFCSKGKFSIIKSKIDALKGIRKALKKRKELQRRKKFEKFEEYIDGFGWRVLNVWLSETKRRNTNSDKIRV